MLLKELIGLIDEDKVENLVLYLFYKNEEVADSYAICIMKHEEELNAIIKKYGDYTIEHLSIVSSKKHKAVSDYISPDYEVLDVTLIPSKEVCDCDKAKDNIVKETIKDTLNILDNIKSINRTPLDQTATDLMTAAACMNRCHSISDFLEFIYHNGYKIGLVKAK